MLTMRQAPSASAARAHRPGVSIDSSRQIGVRIRRCSAACSTQIVLGERLLDHQQAEGVEGVELRASPSG